MYKYASGQMSITDFGQPMGMHLNENNRWVKKAELIPWDEIETRCAGLFKSKNGKPAKHMRLAPGACIIQAEYGYSDKEVALQIQPCQTQMQSRVGVGKVNGYCVSLHCYVRSGSQPQKALAF